jgi:hypothetical protein
MTEFVWVNPPPRWSGDAAALELETGADTDWWSETFYGFTHANGHAWVAPVEGEFAVAAEARAAYAATYDQAGLMVFGAARDWVKAGVEFTDGAMHFSVVVSGPRSDWSMIRLDGAGPDTALRVRLARYADAVAVQFALGAGPWRLARVAPFAPGPCRAGVMACSPSRAGLRASFRDVGIGAAPERAQLGA